MLLVHLISSLTRNSSDGFLAGFLAFFDGLFIGFVLLSSSVNVFNFSFLAYKLIDTILFSYENKQDCSSCLYLFLKSKLEGLNCCSNFVYCIIYVLLTS